MNNREIAVRIPAGYRMPMPIHPIKCPDQLYELMQFCWKHNPFDRVTFEYLHAALSDQVTTLDISYEETSTATGQNS